MKMFKKRKYSFIEMISTLPSTFKYSTTGKFWNKFSVEFFKWCVHEKADIFTTRFYYHWIEEENTEYICLAKDYKAIYFYFITDNPTPYVEEEDNDNFVFMTKSNNKSEAFESTTYFFEKDKINDNLEIIDEIIKFILKEFTK